MESSKGDPAVVFIYIIKKNDYKKQKTTARKRKLKNI
jgi:hypothetical protein